MHFCPREVIVFLIPDLGIEEAAVAARGSSGKVHTTSFLNLGAVLFPEHEYFS
jgi:hypothetical protein